jgi:hypothetical protein
MLHCGFGLPQHRCAAEQETETETETEAEAEAEAEAETETEAEAKHNTELLLHVTLLQTR